MDEERLSLYINVEPIQSFGIIDKIEIFPRLRRFRKHKAIFVQKEPYSVPNKKLISFQRHLMKSKNFRLLRPNVNTRDVIKQTSDQLKSLKKAKSEEDYEKFYRMIER